MASTLEKLEPKWLEPKWLEPNFDPLLTAVLATRSGCGGLVFSGCFLAWTSLLPWVLLILVPDNIDNFLVGQQPTWTVSNRQSGTLFVRRRVRPKPPVEP